MNITAKLSLVLFGLAGAALANADDICYWSFNGTLVLPLPEFGIGVATPCGTASQIGFQAGSPNDPTQGATNHAWAVRVNPAQDTGNLTSGAQFMTGTLGFYNIQIDWDQFHFSTSSKYFRFQYTINGATWTNGVQFSAADDNIFYSRSVDLSGIDGVNNNPLFGFRIVAEFGPSGQYEASNPGSTYSSSTAFWRFDMVHVTGETVPEPAAAVVLVTGLLFLAARRRRRD
jgi:hypothetical protein